MSILGNLLLKLAVAKMASAEKISMRPRDSPRILILYTGGTIGMRKDPKLGRYHSKMF